LEYCLVRASRVTARGPTVPYTGSIMLASPRTGWAILGATLALAACGDSGPVGPPIEAVAWLGTGTTEYQDLPDDSELVLVAGPQGGHHFVVHARMSGLLPGDPTMPGLIGNPSTRFTVTSEAGERLDLNMAPYRLGYREAEVQGEYELTSGRILQVQEAKVVEMLGTRVKIWIEITDVRGAVAIDERWVVAIEDELPPGGEDDGLLDASR
jgi:hypothetical protein